MDDKPNEPSKKPDHKAAADVIRGDIDRIFDGDATPQAQAEKEIVAESQSAVVPAAEAQVQPAEDTQAQAALDAQMAEQWKHYHSSWQSYYKQYYERYYHHYLQHIATNANQAQTPAPRVIGSLDTPEEDEDERTINELREKLLSHVKERAETVRASRHFAPIATAAVFALVFLFLQYNRFFFATVEAYVSPGNIDPQNIIVDPNTSVKVGPESKLIIPKINVEAPTVYGVDSGNVPEVENNLRTGVVHYPISNASSLPGQNGANVILGHSSNDVFDSGAFKFVFVQLNKLEKGDTFYINYQGTRYTYSVTSKEIIDPKDVGKVAGDPSKPTAILITCDPPGTALKRLLVFADQISPNPAKSSQAPKNGSPKSTNIAGNSPTFVERLFGAR